MTDKVLRYAIYVEDESRKSGELFVFRDPKTEGLYRATSFVEYLEGHLSPGAEIHGPFDMSEIQFISVRGNPASGEDMQDFAIDMPSEQYETLLSGKKEPPATSG